MLRHVPLRLLACASLLALGCGSSPPVPDTPPAAEAPAPGHDGAPDGADAPSERTLALPKVVERTARNGMKVYVLEDHRAPIYMQQFWFQVGSANERNTAAGDRPGTTGLSHFFEHLMFRGTKAFPNYFEAVSRMGGQVNAFTWLDETVYWEKLPSRFLEKAVEMEADRFRNLRMDFLNLEPEREVVKSERLMRTENDPLGKLREVLNDAFYTRSPYGWPTVGWMKDLIAIPIEEAERYYRAHYRPNNAFAVFVGDVDADRVVQLIDTYMGDMEQASVPEPPDLAEPESFRERRVSVLMSVKAPMVVMSFPSPDPASGDYVALEVVDALLSDGRSSLLQRALVYGDDPVATSVSTFLFPARGRLPYSITIRGLPGKRAVEIVERVERVIASLASNDLPDAAYTRAVRKIRGNLVRYMKTVYGRAQVIGFSIRTTGDPLLPFTRLAEYGKIGKGDIKSSAGTWLAKNRRVMGFVVSPESCVEASAALAPSKKGRALRRDVLAQVVALRRDLLLRNEVETEEQAIRFLSERAARARARYLAEKGGAEKGGAEKGGAEKGASKVAELDTYLKTGGKGTVTRTKKLAEQRKRLRKQERDRMRRIKALRREIRRRARGSSATERALLSWLLSAAAGDNLPDPPPPPRDGTHEDRYGHALAIAFAFKVRGEEERLRQWIAHFSAERDVPRTEELRGPLGTAHDLLFQIQPIPPAPHAHLPGRAEDPPPTGDAPKTEGSP